MRTRSDHSATDFIELAVEISLRLHLFWHKSIEMHLLITSLLDKSRSRSSKLIIAAQRRCNRPNRIFGKIYDFLEVHDLCSCFSPCLG